MYNGHGFRFMNAQNTKLPDRISVDTNLRHNWFTLLPDDRSSSVGKRNKRNLSDSVIINWNDDTKGAEIA